MERSRKRARYEYSSLENAARDVTPDIYGERQKIKEKVLSEAAAAADGEFSDDDFDFSQISDAIAVAQHLIKVAVKDKHNHSESVQKLPKICFVHQIYSLLPDNTAVDREVQQAIDNGSWRKFHIVGALEDEFALMRKNDYLSMIQDAKDEFLQDIQENVNKQGKNVDPNMFDRFANMASDERCWDVAVSKKTLTSSKYHFSDKELRHLVGYGLLLPQKDPELYWFAIRRQGLFMSNYTKGRVEILRMLKRRQTKDMLEKLLKAKQLKKTVFTHEFLLHDLIGSGRAERHKTTMGDLIRITEKGEQCK
ncbi:hypothetical protein VTP01DRAFT_2082 [Rhizomucor pusillus]|uniref:uncharacterized protein n=1 Tax=Rhizomucor pusillus TaxID=4840 RepID=UPI00374202EE